MKKKNLYQAPELRVVYFEVEGGYAVSPFRTSVTREDAGDEGLLHVSGEAGTWTENDEEASHWF